jgi:hypothetical protein
LIDASLGCPTLGRLLVCEHRLDHHRVTGGSTGAKVRSCDYGTTGTWMDRDSMAETPQEVEQVEFEKCG